MKLMAICETKFHYQDKSPPIDYVCNIASDMQVTVLKFLKMIIDMNLI